jgi:hypothetical protein
LADKGFTVEIRLQPKVVHAMMILPINQEMQKSSPKTALSNFIDILNIQKRQ